MNTKNTIKSLISLGAATALLTGCGGSDSGTAEAQAQPPAAAPNASAASDAVSISGNDQMKFSLTEFTVKADKEVTVVFKNEGKMPKEAMGHNLVILTKGTDTMAFANAAVKHSKNEYVPTDMKNWVVASTRVLGPGESQTITFTAPSEPGDYPFICSFPGHAAVMKGVMKVE